MMGQIYVLLALINSSTVLYNLKLYKAAVLREHSFPGWSHLISGK